MTSTILTRVLPGRRVVIETPDFEEGETVQVSVTKPAAEQRLASDEWVRRFNAWADSHEHLPAPPEEALHRASWYEDEE